MIKIKLTYDKDEEKEAILNAIEDVVEINSMLPKPDEKRKRLVIWAKHKTQ
ncbi:MAG: hypothetical protein IKJ77_00270 [Firmicutes bacterium]|nr:hypothetical protein [Bacillota bacterium]